ncbi:MAG: hypothetical protein RIQ60_2885 [Pseudomonadota bacterium]|jgi:uncharacterized membrane protein
MRLTLSTLLQRPRVRRVVQAVLFEIGGLAVVTPVLTWAFGSSGASSLLLALALSATALAWNYVFNTAFERWEAAQARRGRSLRRRLVHGLGFEGGLLLITVPLIAAWLHIGWLQALLADIGLTLFFMLYTVVFTWLFDRVLGLPASARPLPQHDA